MMTIPRASMNDVLEAIFRRLYSSDVTDREFDRAFELYAEDATFEDPMTMVYGREKIHWQMVALRRSVRRMTPRLIRVYEDPLDTEPKDGDRGAKTASAEADVIYEGFVLPFITAVIKQKTVLVFNDQGKIKRHIDEWYYRDMLKMSMWPAPLVLRTFDAVHNLIRGSWGYASDKLYRATLKPSPALSSKPAA